jgi:hypothetical protein
LKQDTLDFNGFCDNGDSKIFNKSDANTKEPDLPLLSKDLIEYSSISSVQNSKINSSDLEIRIFKLFQIILDFVYEVLTKDDLNQLPSELKNKYSFFNFILFSSKKILKMSCSGKKPG